MMKQSLVGAAAIVALASAAGAADMQPVLKAPAAVDQQATGYVEVYSGWARTESENFGERDRFNGWALGGAGRGNYWVSRDMSVQVDAQAEGTSYDDRYGRFSTHSYLVGGHWSWRNPQQSLFGLFGGVGDAGGNGLFTDSQRHGLIGAEAQWYWHQFTLYGQVGYDTTLNSSGSVDTINAWFIRGTGRYFINPNFLIEGTVMYANGSADFNYSGNPSVDFQTWTWGVKGEWRFATAPFSVFAKYQGSETNYDNSNFQELRDAKVTDHRVLLGLKLHMGDRTLQQTDRAGATLDIISPLANPTSPLMFDVPRREP
jgi:opacity protein-like surface antigen